MKYCVDGFVWNRFGPGFASLVNGLGVFGNSFGEVWGWFCCVFVRIFKKRGETLPSLIRLGRVFSYLFYEWLTDIYVAVNELILVLIANKTITHAV